VAGQVQMVLGTAQWGHGYGITNLNGRISDAELHSIVDRAESYGITAFDTALAYGDAQVRLRTWANQFRVTTKVSGSRPKDIRRGIHEAAEQLGVVRLDACLIHDWDSLDPEVAKRAARSLEDARDEGLVEAVGVSIYGEAALYSADQAFSTLDQVQAPANALDRRLDRSAILTDLAERGVRIQVRSALLQGLLVGPSISKLSGHPAIEKYLKFATEVQTSPIALALGHVRALAWASEVVIGVTSAQELSEVARDWKAAPAALADPSLSCLDTALIDPREWS